MISSLLSRLVILVFGTLYPAYASYKAVKSKNVKEYVKWMMYWIVFALFTCAETLTDLFFSFWFPFYYEIKILIVIWLLCPATKGSSIMYRNFVHPWLSCREEEIDEYIARAKEQSYATVLQLGTKGINYASTVIMQTALKGGGGIMSQLKRSYSVGDISDTDAPERLISRGDSVDSGSVSARRPIKKSNAGSQANLYFPAMDVDVNSVHVPESDVLISKQIQSVEDISSGYCSTDSVFPAESELQSNSPLTRTGSLGSSRIRTRALSGASKRTPSQDQELFGEGLDSDHTSHSSFPFNPSNSSVPSAPPNSLPPVNSSHLSDFMKEHVTADLNSQLFSLSQFLQYHALYTQLINDQIAQQNSETTIDRSKDPDHCKSFPDISSMQNTLKNQEGPENNLTSMKGSDIHSASEAKHKNKIEDSGEKILDPKNFPNINKIDSSIPGNGNEPLLSGKNFDLKCQEQDSSNSVPTCSSKVTLDNLALEPHNLELQEQDFPSVLLHVKASSLVDIRLESLRQPTKLVKKRSRKGPAPQPPLLREGNEKNFEIASSMESLVTLHSPETKRKLGSTTSEVSIESIKAKESSIEPDFTANQFSDTNSVFIPLSDSKQNLESLSQNSVTSHLSNNNNSSPVINPSEQNEGCKNEGKGGGHEPSFNEPQRNGTSEAFSDQSLNQNTVLEDESSKNASASPDEPFEGRIEKTPRNKGVSLKLSDDPSPGVDKKIGSFNKPSSPSWFGSILRNSRVISYFNSSGQENNDSPTTEPKSDRVIGNLNGQNLETAEVDSQCFIPLSDHSFSRKPSLQSVSDNDLDGSSGKLNANFDDNHDDPAKCFKTVKDFVDNLE